MSSIDTRVVEAKFDNNQFLSGVRSTLNSLTQLNSGLQLKGATAGIQSISNGVEKLNNRFSVMRIAATTAISTIAHQATIAGERIVKAFTIGPLLQGMSIYQTKLNSIQTVLANTGLSGKKGLDRVNSALAVLNKYSNQTIYNFSEMARNVGTFTAAGVGLHQSVEAIKGIANLAAISGSNAQQASTAMYQLSQALSAGRVKLQDWNSVVNAGLGGKVFQNALIQTAKAHGVAVDAIIKKEGSFRQSLQTGWITSKILSQTLETFTGDLSKEQLKQMGYTQEQIKGIIKMGKTAIDAATKVKTLPQLMDVLKESVATGWATSFELIIGNLSQAKKLFTSINNSVGGAITKMSNARNKILGDWAKLGGRTALIKGISNAFKDLGAILKPIHDAFREIFPRQTGKQLADLSKSFRDFMAKLKIGADTADNLKRTFAGFFAVLDIGWQVVKAGVKFFLDLLGAITKGQGSGGFLGATASIGDFFVALDKAIKKGHGLTVFFNGLEKILAGPIRLIRALAAALFGIFTFKAPSSDSITKSFEPLGALGTVISKVWNEVISVLKHVFSAFEPISEAFRKFFDSIGSAFANGLGGLNYEDVLHTFDTGLLAGLVLLVKKIVGIFKGGVSAPQGFLDTLMEPFHELTDTLHQMQTTLRATTLLEIASAIGILTLSVIGLSKIDQKGLTRALTALGVMFAQLFVGLIAFTKIGGVKGITATATGLILFAVAVRILTSSVKALSKLSWKELAKGLVGVSALIGGLTLAVIGMNGETAGMIRAGAGLVLLAAGVRILAGAVKELDNLDWEQLGKGLTGVGGILVALTLFTRFASANAGGVAQSAGIVLLASAITILAGAVKDFGKLNWTQIGKGLGSISAILAAFALFSRTIANPVSMVAAGVSLIGLSVAMNILAKAVGKFGQLNWTEIAKGLASMAGSLTLMVAALNLMPPSTLLSATAVLVVATSLGMIAKALDKMGGENWTQIGKGLVSLAGGLGIIAGAMLLMTDALPGAAATLIIAGALTVLAPALLAFAHLTWGQIAKGLVTLAGALTIIGIAGLALTEAIPSLLGLGAAVVLLGVGMLAAGAGVLAFATGLTALSVSAGVLVTSIVAIVAGLVGLIPTIAKELALALVALAQGLEAAGPAIVKAVAAVLLSVIKAIHQDGPPLINTFGDLLVKLARKMETSVPKMADSFEKMLVGLLKATKKNTPEIVNAFADLMVKLLHSLTSRMPDLINAGVAVVVAFIKGISKKLGDIIDAGTDLIIAFIKGIGKNAVKIANAALDVIVDFINGISNAIINHTDELRSAGEHMAYAIADGMTFGLASKAKHVVDSAVGMAKGAYHGVTHFLGINSPSKLFIKVGESIDEGLSKGIIGGKDQVNNALQGIHSLVSGLIQQTGSDIQKYKSSIKELTKDQKTDPKAIADQVKKVDTLKVSYASLSAEYGKNSAEAKKAKDALSDAEEHLKNLTKAQQNHEEALKNDTKALAQAEKEHVAAKNTMDKLNDGLDKQKDKLRDLGKQYDDYTTKIQNARQALQDAIQTRDDYNSSVTDEFNTLPDISADTDLNQYITDLQGQVADTQAFATAVQQLKALGLSDEMYKTLVDKGVDALPFVQQILAGGQASVDELNNLTSELAQEAQALGSTASTNLYQAGVDAAQGLLNGLKSKRDEIRALMEDIAKEMLKAIKKELKIKSPSQEFVNIGVFALKGLSNGLKNSAPLIDDAASDIGNRLINAFKLHVSTANEILNEGLNINPTITPVLDLSQITKDAAQFKDSISTAPISVDASYSQATIASAQTQQAKDATDVPVDAVMTGSTITFIQNNTSPKALSAADIYRQTNNQISVAKGALAKTS